MKWLKQDIDAWEAKQNEPPPETEQQRQARINRLAQSPRKGEREKRRRAANMPQSGVVTAAPRYAYHASGLDAADVARLKDRLKDTYGSKPFRRRVYAPSLGW